MADDSQGGGRMRIIIIIASGLVLLGAAIAIAIYRKKTRKKLTGKKVMLFGPSMSGKTTFLNWLIKDKPTEEHIATGSGNYEEITDGENKTIYTLCDMGGSPGFLIGGVMEKKYKENDFILMFFNCAKFISDNAYKADVEARFDALAVLHKQNPKPVLLIGSHWDKLDDFQKKSIKSCGFEPFVDSSKEYSRFLRGQKLIFDNLTNKKDVIGIWKELSNL